MCLWHTVGNKRESVPVQWWLGVSSGQAVWISKWLRPFEGRIVQQGKQMYIIMGNTFLKIKYTITIYASIELCINKCRAREEGRAHTKYAESRAQGIFMQHWWRGDRLWWLQYNSANLETVKLEHFMVCKVCLNKSVLKKMNIVLKCRNRILSWISSQYCDQVIVGKYTEEHKKKCVDLSWGFFYATS